MTPLGIAEVLYIRVIARDFQKVRIIINSHPFSKQSVIRKGDVIYFHHHEPLSIHCWMKDAIPRATIHRTPPRQPISSIRLRGSHPLVCVCVFTPLAAILITSLFYPLLQCVLPKAHFH